MAALPYNISRDKNIPTPVELRRQDDLPEHVSQTDEAQDQGAIWYEDKLYQGRRTSYQVLASKESETGPLRSYRTVEFLKNQLGEDHWYFINTDPITSTHSTQAGNRIRKENPYRLGWWYPEDTQHPEHE